MGEIKMPKNQILWLTYKESGVPKYLVMSDKMRTKYTLCKVNINGSLEKVRSSKEPKFDEIGG